MSSRRLKMNGIQKYIIYGGRKRMKGRGTQLLHVAEGKRSTVTIGWYTGR